MNNTFPTEGNLSGLSRKDFQKDINDKKTDLFILKNNGSGRNELRVRHSFDYGTGQKR